MSIGKIGEFEPKNESFENYHERLTQYFIANDVKKEKQKAVFLAAIGPSHCLQLKQGYGILNLCYPDNADLILSSLLHILKMVGTPFPRNLSLQFDNASNNKCNEAIAFFAYLVSEGIFHNVYGHTLIVNHTHEDIDRMFENMNQHFKKADMVTSDELCELMMNVPYMMKAKTIPCVWNIMSFLTPFIRTIHDFSNAHHFWLHKNFEGNVVLHYKRYVKDIWQPNSSDPKTFLVNEDMHGILIFKEKPHGQPDIVIPSSPLQDVDIPKLKTSTTRLLEHPLVQDEKLKHRREWWESYLQGDIFQPVQTEWPVQSLFEKRLHQNRLNEYNSSQAIRDVEYEEEEMPLVYSGAYMDPDKRENIVNNQVGLRERGEWPVKKILKERINQRTNHKQFLVEWKPSWVDEKDITDRCREIWEKKKCSQKRKSSS